MINNADKNESFINYEKEIKGNEIKIFMFLLFLLFLKKIIF